MFVNERDVKFEMSNGIVLFEDEEEGQRLTISYCSPVYFSGSITDFQACYKKLSVILTEVFGDKYH
ncbi:MAG: hypothetical protein C4308_05500 [Chitinophagaceae bacterium]